MINIPPRIRVPMWRLMHDFLPKEAALHRPHVPLPSFCALCGFWSTNTENALVWCPVARLYWKRTDLWMHVKRRRGDSAVELVHYMHSYLKGDEFERWTVLLLGVWQVRCDYTHQHQTHAEPSTHIGPVFHPYLAESFLQNYQLDTQLCNTS